MAGLQPLDLSFADPNLGLYPRLGLCAPLVLGRVQPPGLSKGHRSGWFEGQRPGTIPAYGIAIGFGHRNGWRAEGPVSCLGFLAGTDASGLQPSNRFNVPIPGAVPQAGIVRTVGAGEGPTARFVQGPQVRLVRGPTARHHPSLWHRHRIWAREWMEG